VQPFTGEELRTEIENLKSQIKAAQDSAASLEATIRTTPMSVKVQLQRTGDDDGKKEASLAGVIKDEIILIGSLIFFVGIISTDSYYNRFSITYQFLDLPTFHIIYRGLTAPLDSPSLFIPYLLAVGWLALDNFAGRRQWKTYLDFRGVLIYLLIVLLVAIAYPLARSAGERLAETDLRKDTSTLPRVVYLQLKNKLEQSFKLPDEIPAGIETDDEGPAGGEQGSATSAGTPQSGATPATRDDKAKPREVASAADNPAAEKKSENAEKEVYKYADEYRLLVIDSEFVILFKPQTAEEVLTQGKSKVPNIKRLPKGEIDALETIRVSP
jgi:hypothetical protein